MPGYRPTKSRVVSLLELRRLPMPNRRQSVRGRAMLGGVAAINNSGSTMDCVVRNFSEGGACVEFDSIARLPEQMSLSITSKGRSFLARMVSSEERRVGKEGR